MSHKMFSELNLSAELMRAVTEMGFEKATQIQSGAIPLLLSGKDIVAQSETGSGKTAAFAIPMIEKINPKLRSPQGLILCPTRELAVQVAGECARLMHHKRGISVLPVYGGQPIERQIEMLRRGVHIIIGTPGRILDHLERKTLSLSSIASVVLDEADEMLDMGFTDAINEILTKISSKPQMAFFSATLPPDIKTMMKHYMVEPELLKITGKALTVASIKQIYFDVEHRQKTEALCRYIDLFSIKRGIVFCNTRRMVDDLLMQLQSRGYVADGLRGDMKQSARDRVMQAFRGGKIQLLIATDVAGRGIDVDDIDLVVNYDLPQDEEDYVHRVGRTGRAGKTGLALSLVCGRDIYKLKSIERFARTSISRQAIPSPNDVRESITTRIVESIRNVIAEGHLTSYVDIVETACGEDHTPMDVAAALLKMQVPLPTVEIRPEPRRERDFDDNYRGSGRSGGGRSGGRSGGPGGRSSGSRSGGYSKGPRSSSGEGKSRSFKPASKR
jgi:ATP-dependent RNA helicase DeaD